jgi:DNA-binding HxlR family transcriptional regulator
VSGAITRVALRCPDEAASALGISRDYFNEHVRPDLRLIRKGRLVLVLVSELERWGLENAARTTGQWRGQLA